MANRAVLGVAALGTTAFLVREKYKEHLCQQEEKDERQHRQDLMESMEERRRQEEARKNRRNQQTPSFGEDGVSWRQHILSLELLVSFLGDIRRSAVLESRASANLRGLNFPLLLNESNNSPDEVVFAAVLALGSNELLEMILEQGILKPSPDLMLARLSSESLESMVKSFEIFSCTMRVFPCSLLPIQSMSDRVKMAVLTLVLQDSSIPFVLPLQGGFCAKEELSELKIWAKRLGFFVLPFRLFDRVPTPDRKIVFKYKNKKNKEARQLSELLFLSNFTGSFYYHCGNEGKGHLGAPMPIEPFKMVDFNPFERNEELVTFLARLTCSRMAAEAANRLHSLMDSSDDTGSSSHLPVEHISVNAGMKSSFLQVMRGDYLQMLERNKDGIYQHLNDTLLKCIPSPSPRATCSVEDEVASFVKSYTRLLDLSYCLIPIVKGKPPSCFVPEMDVHDAATNMFLKTSPKTFLREKRMLELDERSRIARSRTLMALPAFYAASVIGCLWVLFFWLSYVCLSSLFRWKYVRECISGYEDHFPLQHQTLPAIATSAALAAWAIPSFFGFLEVPLSIPKKTIGYSGLGGRSWFTASCMIESMFRWHCVKVNNETPFHREVATLRKFCRYQHRKWVIRCAKQDFDESLKRKKITSETLGGLLMNCLEEDDDGDEQYRFHDKEFAVGHFPGDRDQVLEFLDIKVVKNESSEAKSCSKMLAEIATETEVAFEEFPVGARVQVDLQALQQDSFDAEEESALYVGASPIGSVISSYSGIILVHLDGEKRACPVPAACCSVIEQSPQPNMQRSKVFRYGNKVRARLRGNSDESQPFELDELEGSLIESSVVVGRVVGFSGCSVLLHVDGEESDTIFVSPDDCEAIEEEDEGDEEGDKENQDPEFEHSFTVREALEAGGWKLERRKNHLVYKRPKFDTKGEEAGREMFTMAATPSDYRAGKNALAYLNKVNREAHLKTANQQQDSPRTYMEKDGSCKRKCLVCEEEKYQDEYSNSQWKKVTGRKCKDCVPQN